MTEPVNTVTLTPVAPATSLDPLRFHLVGDDELTGGVGGWEVVDRTRRRSSAEWLGVQPYRLALPLLTTGLDVTPGVNVSVEPKITALLFLAQKVMGGLQPAQLEVTGPVRVPRPGIRWVIEDIEWGVQVRMSDGQRCQQEMLVRLLEYVPADVLLGPAARARLG